MKNRYLIITLLNALLLFFFTLRPVSAQPGCPDIDAGPDINMACGVACTTLTANVVPTGATTQYAVASIPYNPPYPFNTGTPILVNIDDMWSGLIALPFTFCYYNNNYTQIVAGSNGLISFDASNANNYCPWSFTATCPSSSLPLNSIFGPYHDIDPGVGGTMYYAILGSFPCRTYVVNWYHVPMFSSTCNYMLATQQIVIYESTNIIEVYMQNKPLCNSWNSGNAVVGIQNSTGTVGITAPGRNTSMWSASNEAWRFYPNGPGGYTVTWWQGGTQIGTGTSIQVCPTTTTSYAAQVVYNLCTGNTLTLTDTVVVNYNANFNINVTPPSDDICAGESVTITASGPPNVTYTWTPATGLNTTSGPVVVATPTVTTTYTVTGVDNTNCSMSVPVTITVTPPPVITIDPPSAAICNGEAITLSAHGAGSYSWMPPDGLSSLIDSVVTANPTTTITYIVIGNTNGCTGQAGINVVVGTGPNLALSPPNPIICEGTSIDLNAYGALDYAWSPPNGISPTTGNHVVAAPLVTTTYTVTGNPNGCTGSETITVTVDPIPDADFYSDVTQGCEDLKVKFFDNSAPTPVEWVWDFGDGTPPNAFTNIQNPEHLYINPGKYDVSVLVTSPAGCQSRLLIEQMITVFRTPVADFYAEPPNTWIMEPTIHFYDESIDADKWYWDFGELYWDGNYSNDPSPSHTYTDTGFFNVTLAIASPDGCVDTMVQTVYIAPLIAFYIPNAFTPNNDGVNDVFTFYGSGIDQHEFVMRIFDRWGQQMYFSKDVHEGWNGRMNNTEEIMPSGVYTYILSFKDCRANYHKYKGIINLVR